MLCPQSMVTKMLKLKLQGKFILGLVLLTVVLTVSLGFIVANQYRSSMEEYYSKVAFDEAKIAANHIDGDRILGYYETGVKDEYYEEIRQYLLNCKRTIGLDYFYVVVPEDDIMVYVWDAGEDSEEGVCELGDYDEYYGGGDELMHRALTSLTAKTSSSLPITRNTAILPLLMWPSVTARPHLWLCPAWIFPWTR